MTELNTYRTIVADPPWPQKGGGSLRAGVGDGFKHPGKVVSQPLPYPLMSIQEIAAMDVASIGAPNAHLYLWTTSRFLDDAFDIVKAWGFTYSTLLVWAKNPIGAGLGGAHGIATEFCLFARRGTLPALGRTGRNWWNWKRPYLNGKPRHSAKPPEFFEMVESISPGPYLELFARDARPGWDVWGNQAPDAVDLFGVAS